MSNKDLRLDPHDLPKQNAWWYEEARGISVYVKQGGSPLPVVVISWQSLRAALKRKDKRAKR